MNKETFSRERHWQTQALVDAFVALKENEIVPYGELAKRCKIDEASVHKRVQSAKKIARDEHHVVVDVVRGVGVTRLSQDLVTAPVGRAIGRMRSSARTAHKLIKNGVTDFAKLTNEVKSTLYMQQAIAGTVLLATDRSSRRVLKEHAETTNGALNIGRTLELLK
jgi:hypothetical protein